MIFPLVLGIAGLAVLLSLGFWQVQRLAWKEGLIEQLETRLTAPAIDPMAAYKNPNALSANYLHVAFDATLLAPEAHVYAPQPQGVGYRVVKAASWQGQTILIDLGWVPEGAKNDTRLLGDVAISGHILTPQDYDPKYTPEPDLDKNIFFSRFLPPIAMHTGATPFMVVAQTVETPSGPYTDTKLSPVTPNLPNDHLEYALTWFGLSLIWLGMTAFWVWSIRRQTVSE